jgi:hypothetical protein
MRINKELVAIVVLLLIFVTAGLLLGGRQGDISHRAGDEGLVDRSVYNDRSHGSKAFYEWVEQLGYRPEVSQRNWSDLANSHARVLVAIEPNAQKLQTLTGASGGQLRDESLLTPDDANTLKRWLATGHTAILFTSRLAFSTPNANPPQTFADALNIEVGSAPHAGGASELSPLLPTPLTRGVLSVHLDSGMRIRQKMLQGVDLFGDSDGTGVSSTPVGKGWLLVVADGEFASNKNLNRSDNAVFLSNILSLTARPGDTVLFDEYHHQTGDFSGGPSLWDALGRPAQLALVQLILAALVLVWAVAIRFGTPIPLLQGVKRNTAEYVESLAMLYWRAGASGTALETVYRQFLRDLTSKLALGSDASLEEVAELAARRGQINVGELRHVLAACENAIDTGRINEVELLDLVRRMDRIRKDTGIG